MESTLQCTFPSSELIFYWYFCRGGWQRCWITVSDVHLEIHPSIETISFIDIINPSFVHWGEINAPVNMTSVCVIVHSISNCCFYSPWLTVSEQAGLEFICVFLHLAFTLFSRLFHGSSFFCLLQTWSTAPMSWTSASPTWQTHCWSAQLATAGLWFLKRSSPHTTSWCTAMRWVNPHRRMDARGNSEDVCPLWSCDNRKIICHPDKKRLF